jgi:hypothetical protein
MLCREAILDPAAVDHAPGKTEAQPSAEYLQKHREWKSLPPPTVHEDGKMKTQMPEKRLRSLPL